MSKLTEDQLKHYNNLKEEERERYRNRPDIRSMALHTMLPGYTRDELAAIASTICWERREVPEENIYYIVSNPPSNIPVQPKQPKCIE